MKPAPPPIRLLHLEDSPFDAEMIRGRLAAGGLVCEVVSAANRDSFAGALAKDGFDLILCDYSLPDCDGREILKLARQLHPMTPVVVVSGTLDEEEALECLRLGAADYLLKQRLERLPLAVQRALQEGREHRLRQEAEVKLHESEERFLQLAEHSPDVFWFADVEPERILYVSPAVETVWGLPAERFYQDARAWLAAIHADDQARVLSAYEAVSSGEEGHFAEEYRVIRPDGSVRWVLDSGTPIRDAAGAIVRISGMARDITEWKQAERQVLRTQRLESIGTLASGVAHDLNNALAPVLMVTELMRVRYPDAGELVDTVEEGARRAADMVRQLLTFAKGVEGARLLIQPLHLLKEMEKIVKGSFPKSIQLRATYGQNLRTILGDSTQLHQVLLNLCVNARDAMPNGGTLTLEAENVEIDATYAGTVSEAKPGAYVVWRVSDTGTGIPPEILERIFEPFFSTKGPDKGTGLGLSTVIGIVKSHGGYIRVYSVPGQGTTFTVHLPASEEDASHTAFVAKEGIGFRGNGETVLVVDDEEGIREVCRRVLSGLNFKVLTATDGTEALIQVADHRTDLRVIITDVHMPHMDGLTLVRLLQRMLPQAGIIVTSGRLDEREEHEFKSLGVAALLDKPFTQETLLAALKGVFVK